MLKMPFVENMVVEVHAFIDAVVTIIEE